MPELPEVEMVCRSLARVLHGRSIVSAKITLKRLVRPTDPRTITRKLRQVAIGPITRRAKYIIMPVGEKDALIAHLGMTGRFLYLTPDDKAPQHTHAIFYLDNEHRLAFSDVRQFGHMGLIRLDQLNDYPGLKGLGPEPLSDEFDTAYLRAALAGTRRTLKETLLDQRKVAGLGNIYAAEAMFHAGIDPFIAANRVGLRRIERLHQAIKDVLRESISHGSTMNVNPEEIEVAYYSGGYNGHWSVYDREGHPCPKCGAKIKRIFQAGRSTYFCPRCQKR
jgi:formamidopyrimidine-DNA glycosylase